ncbi:MAG: ArnT family glycosyltransferase, partial [Terriglobales bacterium]
MCLLTLRARKHLPWVLLVGFALRLVFVWFFPAEGGDTSIYKQLAYNWLDHGVYGLVINGQLVPADLRVPGYPAFLAIISFLFRRSHMGILLAQAFLDLGTCLLTALLAAALVPKEWRERVAVAVLWLAATCPFVANYCAVPLTEVLATFLTTAAMLFLIKATCADGPSESAVENRRGKIIPWLLAGVFTGLCTLVRPESPLLLVAVGIVLLFQWRRRADWGKLARACVLLAAGCLAPLVPWAARNWVTLHRVQFLATRYAELNGEFVPRGFYAWTKTWLWRYRDAYTVIW